MLVGIGLGLLIDSRAANPSPVLINPMVSGASGLAVPVPVPVQMAESSAVGPYLSLDERNNIAIYESLNEGVVNVAAVATVLDHFRAFPRSGSGSGVIIDTAGHVLTSYHVIKELTRKI